MTFSRLFIVTCLGLWLSTEGRSAPPARPRILTQVSSINGPAGTTQNLVFKKVRKAVASAVLKVKVTYNWTYGSVSGVFPSGTVPMDYLCVYNVVGSSVPTSYSVSIPYGPGSTPSGYLYQTTFQVPLDPALLTGRGDLLLPVLVQASSSYDTSLYTVVQSATFSSEVVLEYTQ